MDTLLKYNTQPMTDIPNESTQSETISHASGIEELIPRFLENRKEELKVIQNHLDEEEFEAIARIGHTLKGNSRPYGFIPLEDMGLELEMAARDANAEAVRTALKKISDYLSRFVAL